MTPHTLPEDFQPLVLTPVDAQARGWKPLTKPYELPREQHMLRHVLADLHAGAIEFAVCPAGGNKVEVYRTNHGYIAIDAESDDGGEG